MPFAASLSRATNTSDAIRSVMEEVRGALHGAEPDISLLFVNHAHQEAFSQLASRICEATGTKLLIGCTGETIIGGGQEIESGPALSLWSAILPGARLEPFAANFERTVDGIVTSGLPAFASEEPDLRAVFLLADPFSSAPHSVLDHVDAEAPGVPVLGGMASGGHGPGENRLFYNSHEARHGAIGLVVRGGPVVRSVVSQGCRPIGTHYVVTSAEGNVVHSLGGLPPLQRLRELVDTLPEADAELVRTKLHLGLAMSEYGDRFERGDFLIANLTGADRETGSIAIAAHVRVGQTVRFHVRDAATADEDLLGLLNADRTHTTRPQAGLLFSCNGRGTRLFSEPNHDAAAVQKVAGPIPLAGFFAQGEIGPISGRNYIHGFTASIALFE
ncbi:MAG TPA: FIST N-terminal domain-containing protein [Planctomycetaceae bacterium]|jgi:small ligand-binding sensory domain FIST|nr:FIST N-terminal domain-containing protein [Planctomycetaceae bacterium]